MGVDRQTRLVLKDLERESALTKGSDKIAEVRAAYDRVFGSWTALAAGPTQEVWVQVEADGQKHSVLVIEPLAQPSAGTILFIHGGGWSLGNALCYGPVGRDMAATSGMRVLVADFPQSPEAPYPAAMNALVGIAGWALSTYGEGLTVSGDSAGGMLAAMLSGHPELAGQIKGQALYYPVLDLRPDASYRSRKKFGSGKFFLSEAAILGASMGYCGEAADPSDPLVSPILTPAPEALPPTFILLPDCDPLKDEGEAYGALLKRHGVDVEIFRARKTIHGCISFSGRIEQGLAGLRAGAAFLKGHA